MVVEEQIAAEDMAGQQIGDGGLPLADRRHVAAQRRHVQRRHPGVAEIEPGGMSQERKLAGGGGYDAVEQLDGRLGGADQPHRAAVQVADLRLLGHRHQIAEHRHGAALRPHCGLRVAGREQGIHHLPPGRFRVQRDGVPDQRPIHPGILVRHVAFRALVVGEMGVGQIEHQADQVGDAFGRLPVAGFGGQHAEKRHQERPLLRQGPAPA